MFGTGIETRAGTTTLVALLLSALVAASSTDAKEKTVDQEILEIRSRTKNVKDMRTAAYICAIQKVARGYLELGIFP